MVLRMAFRVVVLVIATNFLFVIELLAPLLARARGCGAWQIGVLALPLAVALSFGGSMATNKAPVEHGGSGDFELVLFAKIFAVLFVDRAARFHDVDAGKGGDKGRQCKLNRVLHWYMFQGLKIVRFELQKISFREVVLKSLGL